MSDADQEGLGLHGSRAVNVILLLTDDMGEWAYGFLGSREVVTPNIDHLAASGTTLRNLFCTSPVCSPARASLLTGLVPSQHGVLDFIVAGNTGEDARPFLRPSMSFTNVLSDSGFVCGLSGKWHLGDSVNPQQGFSHWYAHESSGGPYTGAQMVRGGRLEREEQYLTDAIADDAAGFIRAAVKAGRPFFSSVHFTAPHAPWVGQHPEEYTSLYEDSDFEWCPQETPHPNLRPLGPNIRRAIEEPRESLIGYHAAVSALDAAVGRILAEVRQLRISETTLVVLLTDNGFNAGHHGIWGKGNGTYPANMYDTSVRTPAIFSQPGVVAPGEIREDLVSAYDLRSTILEHLGVEDSLLFPTPGRSFSTLLTGDEGDRRDFVVVFDEYGSTRMIRTSQWKLVSQNGESEDELYDVREDPQEQTNRFTDPAASRIAAELGAELDRWFARMAVERFDGREQPVRGTGQLRPICKPMDAGAFQGPEDPFCIH